MCAYTWATPNMTIFISIFTGKRILHSELTERKLMEAKKALENVATVSPLVPAGTLISFLTSMFDRPEISSDRTMIPTFCCQLRPVVRNQEQRVNSSSSKESAFGVSSAFADREITTLHPQGTITRICPRVAPYSQLARILHA